MQNDLQIGNTPAPLTKGERNLGQETDVWATVRDS